MKNSSMLLMSAILWIAGSLCATAQWELQTMDKGGVVEDLQLVYHDGSESQDQAWAACMNTGIYRATWGGSVWSTWTQYIPGKKCFGVDAIEVGGTEYVLCASQGLGLRYGSSASGSFTNWDWPNPDDYPGNWKHAGNHDAAFYWPVNGFGENPNPQSQYYVILTGGINESGEIFNPGLYRWNPDAYPDPDFDALAGQPQQPQQYSHFYRDLKCPNVLYVIRGARVNEDGDVIESGGLYRIHGTYGSEVFTSMFDMLAADPHPDHGYYSEIVGFNQWKQGNSYYYYIYYHEKNAQGDNYQVYVSDNLWDLNWSPESLGDPIYECSALSGSNLDWTEIYDYQTGYRVVGKPTGGLNASHRLWMATDKYGMWYVETDPDDPGDPLTEEQINDGLKRWAPRMVIPDPDHITGSEIMRILFGTHQKGVWYLKFSR